MNTAIAIRLENVSKSYRLYASAGDRLREALHPLRRPLHREFRALGNVSFELERGETLGILGVNGSGKSTLLEIISGILQPSSGEVTVNGRIAALIELGAGFNPDLSGRANAEMNAIFMGLTPQDAREKLGAIEAFADIGSFFEQPVRTYSSGMLMRVAFATAVNVDPDILIVDEALAVGDARFQQKCFARFRGFQDAGKTILLVTHDRHAVPRLCSRGMVLSGGNLVYFGTPQAATAHYGQILMQGAESPAPAGADTSSAAESLPELQLDAGASTWGAALESTVDRCPSNPTYNPNEHRVGIGGARIVDYRIMDRDVENPSRVRSGSTIGIQMRVAFDVAVESPIVGFSVKSTDGTLVFGMNSLWLDTALSRRDANECGIYRFHVQFDLAPGDWFIDLAIASAATEILDSRGGMIHIRTDPAVFCTGIACLKSSLVEEH